MQKKGFAEMSGYMFGDEVAKVQGYEPVGLSYGASHAVDYHVVQSFLSRNKVTIAKATLKSSADIMQCSGVFG
ncbi:DUF2268 domain-containing putative Zn-dependent protease [Paenibacillus apiarius]|uniref:DUF2268 domain-containing putative Zn-dependent protease n=1 Tax=Paenibacillus apiarius TaxID=46240 RepID=UPI0020CD0BDC|nr:DUF2268 domain-containing putative Zn-dependent protease [Paenibacillus apiarius]MEC0121715.1 DUF2268 domain-containing putative Zn-dependent protease [Paenibacillus apiarius]MEC0192836.1 DUF2268 domain-containing putative Zn-dependent protease [Paenibacillus apiarius]